MKIKAMNGHILAEIGPQRAFIDTGAKLSFVHSSAPGAEPPACPRSRHPLISPL